MKFKDKSELGDFKLYESVIMIINNNLQRKIKMCREDFIMTCEPVHFIKEKQVDIIEKNKVDKKHKNNIKPYHKFNKDIYKNRSRK